MPELMHDLEFGLFQEWCEGPLHQRAVDADARALFRSPRLMMQERPVACVRVGGIAICEACLTFYVDHWDDALTEWFIVTGYREDRADTVELADEIVREHLNRYGVGDKRYDDDE